MNTNDQPDYVRAFFGGAITGSLLKQTNAKFRNGYLTDNERRVEKKVDEYQAAGLYNAAIDIRAMGQVAQDLLDLICGTDHDEPFDWGVVQTCIDDLTKMLR